MAVRACRLALLAALGVGHPASAQLSASLAAVSDYRIRGLSLNGGGIALTASAGYDHPSGIYAGAAVTAGDTRRYGRQYLGHVEYLGYSARFGRGLAWEAGVSNTHLDSNVFRRFSGHYPEVYAGISAEKLGVRVAYSPAYVLGNLDTLYCEVNGALRPVDRLRVFAHAGVFVPLSDVAPQVLPRARIDTRLGVAATIPRGELRLTWVHSGAGEAYLAPRHQSADALTVGATAFF